MLIWDVTGIDLREFPRIKALDDSPWAVLGDVVFENALLDRHADAEPIWFERDNFLAMPCNVTITTFNIKVNWVAHTDSEMPEWID